MWFATLNFKLLRSQSPSPLSPPISLLPFKKEASKSCVKLLNHWEGISLHTASSHTHFTFTQPQSLDAETGRRKAWLSSLFIKEIRRDLQEKIALFFLIESVASFEEPILDCGVHRVHYSTPSPSNVGRYMYSYQYLRRIQLQSADTLLGPG